MRQHVNPLSRFFQLPIELPSVKDLFATENLPIHLDIGSARGKFLIDLAVLDPKWNYLGLEIRNSLVYSAQQEKDQLELENLAFHFCNVNVSLENWISQLKYGQLQRVSIQFPDPWFKRRHYKRKVLQPELLVLITQNLQIGSQLFIQSDILSIIEEMESLVELTNCFDRKHPNNSRFIACNPFNINTERENYAIRNNLPVYRILFERNSEPCFNLCNLPN